MLVKNAVRHWILGAMLLGLLLAGFWYWRFAAQTEVAVIAVRAGDLATRVSGPGMVQARTEVTLSARLTGAVVSLTVDVGDRVQAGQSLIDLDDREPQARVSAVLSQQRAVLGGIDAASAALVRARAELELAQSKLRRDAELLQQGYVSQAVVDASTASVRITESGVLSAQATLASRRAEAEGVAQELAAAQAALSHTRLASPLSGLVVQRWVEPGSLAIPGAPLLKLIDPATLWVATRVDETVVGSVSVGQPAAIRLRNGEQLKGHVALLARQSDAATRELDVFVAFDSLPRQFALNQEAEVSIETGKLAGLLVPETALIRDKSGRLGVLLAINGKTEFRPVRSSASDAQWVLVSDGVTEGDQIVIRAAGLRSGQAIRPRLAS